MVVIYSKIQMEAADNYYRNDTQATHKWIWGDFYVHTRNHILKQRMTRHSLQTPFSFDTLCLLSDKSSLSHVETKQSKHNEIKSIHSFVQYFYDFWRIFQYFPAQM